MIATLAEIKTLLGISGSTQDAQIAALIPIVEADLIEHCNNDFLNDSVQFLGDCTITAAGGVYKIECADGGMDAEGFAVADPVYLDGSVRNDNYYTVKTIAAGYIEVNEATVAESTATAMTVTLVTIPAALKIYFARMISWQLNHANDAGMQSENIGNYSYSMAKTSSDAGYPADILRGLDKWRRIRAVRGSIIEAFRERRGSTSGLASHDDIALNHYKESR